MLSPSGYPFFATTMEQRIKFGLYARKSSESEDRQVLSIDSQIEELEVIAKKDGITIHAQYKESKSAKAPHARPEFQRMVDALQSGEISGILCWKLDRLTRNPVDAGILSWLLQTGVIKQIRTHDGMHRPEDNVLLFSVETSMANQYIRDLSVNVKRGLHTKAKSGWFPSKPPVGYKSGGGAKGQKILVSDTERLPLIRKIFDYILTGAYTAHRVWQIATTEWGLTTTYGKPLTRSHIYNILANPFYYGMYEYPRKSGVWHHGLHEPVITKDEFNKVQDILNGRPGPKPHTKLFAYTGLIRCANCGASITAEQKRKVQKNGNVHEYTYYHCTHKKDPMCKQGSVEEKKLEEQIRAALSSISIPPDFHDWAMRELRRLHEQEQTERNGLIDGLRRQHTAIVSKLDNLVDMRSDGEITAEEFAQKKNVLTSQKEQLQCALKQADDRVDSWLDRAEHSFNFARDAVLAFNEGSLERRREILLQVGSNLSLFNGILALDIDYPLLRMGEAIRNQGGSDTKLEPPESGALQKENEHLYARNPLLLRSQDSNLEPSP